MNWFSVLLGFLVKWGVMGFGLVFLLSGPVIEQGGHSLKGWRFDFSFHQFTDKKAILLRVVGLAIVILSILWMFSTRWVPSRDNTVPRLLLAFCFFLILVQSVFLIIFGSQMVKKIDLFSNIVDEEVMSARLWGLVFLVLSLIAIYWYLA
jgi:hypothetical protein